MAVLARGDAPRGEALAVAHAIHVVDDRNLGIARQQEIGVHGMRRAAGLDRAHGGDQRLADHLAAEHALPADLRRAAAEQVYVQLFEIEDAEQFLDGGGHGGLRFGGLRYRRRFKCPLNLLCSGGFYKEAAMAKALKQHHKTDLVIGGAGFAGLALAIALRQGLGERFRGDGGRSGARGGAVEGPARLGDRGRRAPAVRGDRGLGRGRADAQPILDMVVTDSNSTTRCGRLF